MNRVYSNGPAKDFVMNPFSRLLEFSARLHLAAPYFTLSGPILDAVKKGKSVQLLVGLNAATSPKAMREVHEVPGLAVRYLTSRFHAKIYIFDDAALLGSSNLTDGGLISNREAVICLDQPDDFDAVEEGERIEVYRYGKPIAIVSPAQPQALSRWRSSTPLKLSGVSLSQAILQERQEN